MTARLVVACLLILVAGVCSETTPFTTTPITTTTPEIFEDYMWRCSFSFTPEYTCTLDNVVISPRGHLMIFERPHLPGMSDSNVTRVQFVNSRIAYIPREIFGNFNNLVELRAARSNLGRLDNIYACYELQTLDLSWNNLVEIPEKAFENCRNLRNLNLGYNQIEKIERYTFANLTNLITLGLPSNRLTSFYVEGLNNLRDLALQQNRIGRLTAETFKNMGNVEVLQLTGNGFNVVNQEIFKPLTNLITLLISQNNLPVIPGDTFHANKNIELLSMSFNNINRIGRNFFDGIPKLKYLEMRSNVCVSRKFFIEQEGLGFARSVLEPCFQNYENAN